MDSSNQIVTLKKVTNDPKWSEVIKLYSGLFDTQSEREDFIINLANSDILLAAECKSSSIENEAEILDRLNYKITSLTFESPSEEAKALLALLEIGSLAEINDRIIRYKHKNSNISKLLDYILSNYSIGKFFDFYSILVALRQRLSTKEKNYLRVAFKSVKENNTTLKHYLNILINKSSASNITEIKKVANDINISHSDNPDNTIIIEKIKELINQRKPLNYKQAISLVIEYKLFEQFDVKSLIEYFLNIKSEYSIKHSKVFIEKLHLESEFPDLISQPKIKFKQNSKSSSTDQLVSCTVLKIIDSRVFVKIEGDSRLASIYIGELANERIENIFSFKYNDVILHKGQAIVAKVKSIDNQNRVNLTLRGLSNLN
jgi:hypothetical protein